MFSFILLFVVLGGWLRTTEDLKPRWWLIPLMWIWASSHGYWYFGIAVGIVVTVGISLDRRANPRQSVILFAVSGLSIAAAGLTPAGPSLLLSAFQTNDKWQFVSEWAPPNFMSVNPAVSMLMVAIVVLIWSRGGKQVSWSRVGLLLLGLAWLLMAARTVTAGAIVIAPLLAASLHGLASKSTPDRPRRSERIAVVTTGGVCLAVLALVVPSTASSPGDVPTQLDAKLASLSAGTGILNEYALGGWLHWSHPDLETVIDGFTDGYTVEALEQYFSVTKVERGWEAYIAKTGVHAALLYEDSPLAVALEEQLHWKEEGRDEGYVLLISPPSQS